MASSPQLTVPDVAPSAQPLPTQRLDAPSAAFGPSVAAGALTDLGKVAEQHGADLAQFALQVQGINNKQAADAKFVGMNTQLNNMLSDFKTNNLGVDPKTGQPMATTNLPQLYTKMDQLRAQGADGLSPMAQVEYEANSRRALSYAQSNARDFAVTEQRKARIATSDAVITQAQGAMIAGDPFDKVQQGILASSIAGQLGFQGSQQGWSQEQGAVEVQKALGTVYLGQVKTLVDTGNYPQAKTLFNDNKNNMTPAQLEQAVGMLKVAGNSFEANSVAQTVPVYGAPGTRSDKVASAETAVPKADWDTGIVAFHADAEGTLQQLLGQSVTITSAERTAAHNAAVGGSNSSEHLAGNAWDFVPSKSSNLTATALDLSNSMHAAGIPFDQIEVDTRNGNQHIHVGFGPQNRNEVITQGGQRLQQGTAQPAVQTTAFPDPNRYDDPENYLVDAERSAQTYARDNYSENPDQGKRVEAAVMSQVNMNFRAMNAHQRSVYNQVAGFIQDSNGAAQSITDLPPSLVSQLSPSQHNAVEADLKRNANEITPEREAQIDQLRGDQALNPQKFIATDLSKLDLPRSYRMLFTQEQDKMQKVSGKAMQENTAVSQALNAVPGQQALKAAGIPTIASGAPDKNSTEYAQFYGALQAEVEANSTDGKPPSQKDMNILVSRVAAKIGAKPASTFLDIPLPFTGNDGTSSFVVPDTDRTRITGMLQTAGVAPTENLIGKQYRYEQIKRGQNSGR